MSELNDMDPIGRLREANPTPADDVPDASLARVSARIQEHIMADDLRGSAISSSRRRLSVALLGGAALTGVLVIAFAAGGFGGQQPGGVAVATATPDVPSATDSPDVVPGGGGMASCIMYDPALLPTFDVVFDGTVTAVDGDQITFDVNEGWKGASGSLTLTAPESHLGLTGPLPDFHVGGRYLVTAYEGTMTSCGYTLDYDAGEAADWAAAFKN